MKLLMAVMLGLILMWIMVKQKMILLMALILGLILMWIMVTTISNIWIYN